MCSFASFHKAFGSALFLILALLVTASEQVKPVCLSTQEYCDFKTNYRDAITCVCISCQKYIATCTNPEGRFYQEQCAELRYNGYCTDIFLPKTSTAGNTQHATGSTSPPLYKPSQIYSTIVSKPVATENTSSSWLTIGNGTLRTNNSTLSNIGVVYSPWDLALLICLGLAVVIICLVALFGYLWFRKSRRGNTAEKRHRQDSIMDVEDENELVDMAGQNSHSRSNLDINVTDLTVPLRSFNASDMDESDTLLDSEHSSSPQVVPTTSTAPELPEQPLAASRAIYEDTMSVVSVQHHPPPTDHSLRQGRITFTEPQGPTAAVMKEVQIPLGAEQMNYPISNPEVPDPPVELLFNRADAMV